MGKQLAFIILGIAFLSTSCMSNRKVVLFKSKEDKFVQNLQVPEYKIRSNDFLYINIGAVDADLGSLLNEAQTANEGNVNNIQPVSLYFSSYHVSDSGKIELPVVGKIDVLGLSIAEAENQINESFARYFKNIRVSVRFPGVNFSVLGEVRRPGQFTVYQESVNIMEALASAGDFADFANRESVTIYRRYEQSMQRFEVNLLDRASISNPNFFVQPGDVIFVEPLARKHIGLGTTGIAAFQTMVSILSSVVLIVNLTK